MRNGTQFKNQRFIAFASWTVLCTGLAIAVFVAKQTLPASTRSLHVTAECPTSSTRQIANIRVGDRVLAENPLINNEDRDSRIEPNWELWRRVHLEMPKADDSVLLIDMIRPSNWMSTHCPVPGGMVKIDLPELGAKGFAKVISINEPPKIEKGSGHVVTATFQHSPSTDLIDAFFDGDESPVGVTTNHPFWCVEHRRFLPIGQLAIGEHVVSRGGEQLRLRNRIPRALERVYNLEVYGEHVYYVGAQGILAHNSYNTDDVIRSSEKLRGHGVAKHAGKSMGYLRNRIRTQGIPVASTFKSKAELKFAVDELIKGNQGKIKRWVENPAVGPPNQMKILMRMEKKIGRGLERVGNKIKEVDGFEYVEAYIKRSSDSPFGFELITIFPSKG